MELISVRCNHCGAPLDVGEKTRFVTCQFCKSQLEIKRSESAVFTEEVARIVENTEKMAGSLEVIRLQNEIEQLDREWSLQQSTSGSERHSRGPQSVGGAIFGLGFAIFFALVCFGMAAAVGGIGGIGGMISLVPIGMGIFALVAGVMGVAKAGNAQSSQRFYQEQRDALVRRLNSMNGSK
jgi:hypothetical protein